MGFAGKTGAAEVKPHLGAVVFPVREAQSVLVQEFEHVGDPLVSTFALHFECLPDHAELHDRHRYVVVDSELQTFRQLVGQVVFAAFEETVPGLWGDVA